MPGCVADAQALPEVMSVLQCRRRTRRVVLQTQRAHRVCGSHLGENVPEPKADDAGVDEGGDDADDGALVATVMAGKDAEPMTPVPTTPMTPMPMMADDGTLGADDAGADDGYDDADDGAPGAGIFICRQ